MTTPGAQPFNYAGDGTNVGVQGQTVTITGDVQLTVGQDASPAEKYKAGTRNLTNGKVSAARRLIWEAMMGEYVNSKVLFHWLVAMLSGRTVQQFSKEEVDQLRLFRSRCTETGGDAWADGVRLIYRLLDSVLPPHSTETEPKTDMSLLVEQFDDLGEDQQNMVRPHLELFLTGPLKDEIWGRELKLAQPRQHTGNRLGRAWMFFQPIPAEVVLPQPQPELVTGADRLRMRASAVLFAAAAGYLGWELLWHGAILGLLGYVAGLAGGTAAAANGLEWRFLSERRRLKDEQFRPPNPSAPRSPGDEFADRVDKLFNRYFVRYAPDKTEREYWKAAAAGIRQFHRDEIIEICRSMGFSADQVVWLIRYEVRQLKQRWQKGTLHDYQQWLRPRSGTVAACRAGLAILVLGGFWTILTLFTLRADLPTDALGTAVTLLSAVCAWRYWLRVNLESRRYAADSQEREQRQADIAKEYARWSERLKARPKDAEMAVWLESDRTVLLGMALDHFHLPRSRLIAHAFLEEPGVAARRARIEGGLLRYERYRLLIFLLAEDGVRQVRANLDFLTGTLTIRERTNYRYDAIVSVRVLREAQRQTFELRLTAGDPITVQVRDAEPEVIPQDENAEPMEETEDAQEDADLDVASVTNTLHVLEGVAAEGQKWLRAHEWDRAWAGDDEAVLHR